MMIKDPTKDPTVRVRHHNFSTLIDPSGKEIQIDSLLVPLIKEAWRNKIKTRGCCQGERGGYPYNLYEAAYITFTGKKQADRFLELLGKDIGEYTILKLDSNRSSEIDIFFAREMLERKDK